MAREETVETVRRPTPLDPYPEPRPTAADGDEKAYPPELGTDAIAVLEGRSSCSRTRSETCPPARSAAWCTTTRASSTGGRCVSTANPCRSPSHARSTTTRPRSTREPRDQGAAPQHTRTPPLSLVKRAPRAARRRERRARASLVRAAPGLRDGLRRSVRDEERRATDRTGSRASPVRRPVGAVLLRGLGIPRSLHGPGRA